MRSVLRVHRLLLIDTYCQLPLNMFPQRIPMLYMDRLAFPSPARPSTAYSKGGLSPRTELYTVARLARPSPRMQCRSR